MAHTAAQGEREDDPFSSASSNCSGIQDTLRSWAGDARARAKRDDSSFESPIAEYRINDNIMKKKIYRKCKLLNEIKTCSIVTRDETVRRLKITIYKEI